MRQRALLAIPGHRTAAPTPRTAPAASAAPQRLACACGGGCPGCAAPSRADEAFEREADRWADAVTAPQPPGPRPGRLAAAPAAAAGAGSVLPDAVRRDFEPRFGRAFSAVRLHHDAGAQALSATLGARAFTQGGDIFFGAGEYAPGSARGRHLLAHELAHTLQPQAHGRIARKTLTDLPQSVRLAIQVARAAPAPAEVAGWITKYFNPKGGASATPGLALEWGAEISDVALQKNLGAIVFELLAISATAAGAVADPETWPLGPNSLIDLALDLRAGGGEHAVVRFTRYSEGSTERVLVEKLRVLAAAGTTATAAPVVSGSFTGRVTVGSIHVDIDSGFGNDRGKQIADAVALLPEALRGRADGLGFADGGAGQGPGGENGHYDATTDRVSLYGDLFAASLRQAGTAGNSAYQIVHEIGHAVDLRPLYAAQRARDAAIAAKKKLEAPKPFDLNSKDPLGGETAGPGAAELAEIARLKTEITTQNAAMAKAKSVAGSEVGTATESLLTDFAKALAADGVKAVPKAKQRNAAAEAANLKTDAANRAALQADPAAAQQPLRPLEKTLSTGLSRYAATDLMEAYAENYTLYVLDEALLLALRPKTHAYFTQAQPKAPSSP